MVSKTYSLREAINILNQHRDKLEIQIGKSNLEQLLFNLEEISLDLECIASLLVDVATNEVPSKQLPEIFDSFQYGSIPHILGHLETIEELLESNTNSNETSDKIDKIAQQQEGASASTPCSQ
jgi:hypothetical protein